MTHGVYCRHLPTLECLGGIHALRHLGIYGIGHHGREPGTRRLAGFTCSISHIRLHREASAFIRRALQVGCGKHNLKFTFFV